MLVYICIFTFHKHTACGEKPHRWRPGRHKEREGGGGAQDVLRPRFTQEEDTREDFVCNYVHEALLWFSTEPYAHSDPVSKFTIPWCGNSISRFLFSSPDFRCFGSFKPVHCQSFKTVKNFEWRWQKAVGVGFWDRWWWKVAGVGVAAETQRLMTVFSCTPRFPYMVTLACLC